MPDFTPSQIVATVVLAGAAIAWIVQILRKPHYEIDPFKTFAVGSLCGVIVEAAWQAITFLRLGAFESHALGEIWPNAKPIATDWVGLASVLDQIAGAPIIVCLLLPLVVLID